MTARADAPAPAGTLGRLAPVMSSLALIGFVCATVVQFPMHGADDWERRLLETALLWLIGVEGLLIGFGHLVSPDRVAELHRLEEQPVPVRGQASQRLLRRARRPCHSPRPRMVARHGRGVLDLLPRRGRWSRPRDRFQRQPLPRQRRRGPRLRRRRSDPSDRALGAVSRH